MIHGRDLSLMLMLSGALIVGTVGAAAQDQSSQGSAGQISSDQSSGQSQSSDNTKTNQRDRDNSQLTADQQKENPSDRELARKVRRAIVSDKSLSTYAHNIKVIAKDGTVTLKGPVHSEQEKQAIKAKAGEAVGQDKVKNEISVKGDKSAER